MYSVLPFFRSYVPLDKLLLARLKLLAQHLLLVLALAFPSMGIAFGGMPTISTQSGLLANCRAQPTVAQRIQTCPCSAVLTFSFSFSFSFLDSELLPEAGENISN